MCALRYKLKTKPKPFVKKPPSVKLKIKLKPLGKPLVKPLVKPPAKKPAVKKRCVLLSLPEELIEHILLFLDVKSIGRCRRVSKYFLYVASSPFLLNKYDTVRIGTGSTRTTYLRAEIQNGSCPKCKIGLGGDNAVLYHRHCPPTICNMNGHAVTFLAVRHDLFIYPNTHPSAVGQLSTPYAIGKHAEDAVATGHIYHYRTCAGHKAPSKDYVINIKTGRMILLHGTVCRKMFKAIGIRYPEFQEGIENAIKKSMKPVV